MNLKDARKSGKLAQFIAEQEGRQAKAKKGRFNQLVKAMASQKSKPKPGTSPKGSREN